MEFPVDLLATVKPEALEQSAKDYMSKLLYRNPEDCESLSLPDSSEVEIGLCNVSFVPLYGGDSKQKVLALFSPEDRFKAIGLYLRGQWWSAEDILKTADPSRTGLLKVRTTGERIVLYVLNKIIYRTKEKANDDVHFLCHEEDETAKILWKDGEAIGFYSVKPEGTLCSNFLTQCYQLPIMDTIFIRKCHRGKGYGLQMLEDFIRTFRKDSLGLKYPLTPAMYKVCKNYLGAYPADRELLWEVEGIGGPFQRTLIARKLQTMELKGDHKVVSRLNFETESTDVPVEKVTTQGQKTMEYTVEVVEEVVQIKITKEVQDTPVTTRGRSSNLKRRKLGEDTEATTEKIIRVEDIEAGVQCPVDESMSEVVRSSLDVTASNLKETTVSVTHGEENVLDVTQVQFKEHKEMAAESEECVLEVCALTKPTAEPATVTPEDALEKTELFQMTPFAEIQSMNSNEETQVVKSFEATIGSVDLQPLELQQVVGVEVVKMTSGTEELKEKTIEVTGTKDETEEDRALSEEVTSLQKPSQQKTLSMISEDSTVTEVRVLRKSSKVSSAAPQRKCTCIHKELQVASKDDKAAPKHRATQSIEAVQQSAQVVDQPENEEDQEKRKGLEKEKEEVVDIIRDADKACLIQGENTEETDVMNEEVLTEKDKVGPQVAVLEVEDINTDVEKILAEENRAETFTSVVELVEAQDNETSEELLEPKNQPDVAGTSNEEGESVEKEKAGTEQVALSGNVVGGIEETEERNENMETQEDAVDDNEAVSVTQKEHMDNVQEEEAMKDIGIVQESIFEKEQKLEVQSHDVDDEAKSDNRTELIEEEASDEASSSCLIRKHDGQRSGNETPLRRSQRYKDQTPDDELTRRVLRSGTKSVTTVSKQRHVQHNKTVRQQEVGKHAGAEPEVEQTEDVMETHTDVEGEKMETVIIVVDDENVKGDVEEMSSMEKEHLEPKTSGGHDLEEVESKMEDSSQTDKKVDEEQERTVDAILEVAETTGHGRKIVAVDFDDTVKDAELEVEEEGTLQSVEEPAEEQEEEPSTEMAQNSQVEPTEKEETAEMVISDDSGQHQKEVQENITSGCVETVQESLPEEETPVITSRSLRRRTVTVMSPLQSKPKRLQKTEVEMAGNERVVVVETTDNVDRVSTKEPEESKDEKIETEDGAVSNDEDRVPKSADTDQGRMEVVLEEQPLKETKTLQEIPGNTEMEMKEVSEPSHEDEEDKSDNRTEPTMEDEDSDKADQSGSTKKHAEPTEEQEEEPSVEMAQNSQVEPTEKEQRDSEQLVEMADSENTVKIKLMDKTETEDKSKENRENENDAVSKDEDTVPESTDSDQVMQEEEPLKVPGNEELEMKDISKPSCEDENDKPDKWTEATEEDKDSDKADQSGSTRKHADSKRSNYATPSRHSVRLKDQPVEGELTERVLRSGTKSVTTISKQKHVRHTKTVSQQEESAQAVGEPEVEQEEAVLDSHTGEAKGEKINTVSMSSAEEDSKTEKQHLEAETTDDLDLTEVENKIGAGSQNETTGDGMEIAVMVLDDTEVVKDAEKQADDTTTTLQSGEEQEKEPATEMAEKEDGQIVVESTSTTAVPSKQTCDTETTEEYSLEEQVVEADADKTQKIDSEQEESMLAEENLKDDGVGEITVEEQSTAAVAENTAEMVISDDSGQHQKEVQENVTSGCVETVQESLPEEETPVITSRSLRRRTVTVMSPLQSKPKRLQKAEVEMAGNERAVVVETTDNVDRVSTKEPEESRDDKIETEDGAVSNDEDRVPKSADTDQGRMEVVLEEQPLKETKTPQEIPDNTEMEMKEVSEPSHEDEEDKSDNRTEPTMEDEDSDKADQSGSTKKHADSRRSNYATPLRRSGRLKDQPVEGELRERVLRSGTKSITTISKQKHVQHTKTASQQEESAQAVGEQTEEVMESHTEAAVSIGSEEDKETLKDNVEEESKMEVVKDAEREVEGKTTQEPVGEPIEMTQKQDGQEVVESTSVSTLDKAAVALVDFNKVQTSDTETTQATSQSLEEADQELDKPASTKENREENKKEGEEVKQAESLDEPVEKAKIGWSETPTTTLSQGEALALEMGVEELMTEEQVVEVDADKMLRTGTEQEESMLTDYRAGEITLEVKSSAAEAESMVVVHTSDSEKHQKEIQDSITSGHVETVQESSPEEETPVITSRSLRRRTITVMSPLQRKPKRLQKTEVEISENENVIVTVVTEKLHTSSIENKVENKAEVSVANDDSVPESAVINQGQMVVVQEAEHVKETSVPQKIPANEIQSAVLELSESSHADEVVKDAVIEVEGKAQEQLISEPVEEHVEKPSKEMIPGQGEQKGEEATASLKLQKASVVLVDFNKAAHKQTTDSGTAKETLQPLEEVCQEVEEPADISMDIEESKEDDKGMKLKQAHTESTETEQADESVVVIAERENVVMDDVQNKTAEGTSEIRDDNDELMEIEEGGVKAVLELVQEKEPIKETSAVQEVPCDTQIQEPTQADEEESHTPQEVFSDTAHVEDKRKQADNERSEVGTPGRRSRRLADQPAVSELTTRVLRSCTKQVKATSQQHTRQIKAMVHKEDHTVDNAGEKMEEIKKFEADVAEGEKMETVTTGGVTEHLFTAVEDRVEENSELETEKIEAVKDSKTEQDKVTAEDDAEATTDEEKIPGHDVGDITKAAEMRVEGKTAAQPEPVEEQAPVTETAQNENAQNAVEPTSALTPQEATVVLVDLNKVQTGDSETTEGTSQSLEEGDNQTNVVEDRKESDKESAEKEQTVENEPRDEEDLNRADVIEETEPLPEMEVEEPMAEILEESVVDMGADNSLNTGSEHVELVLSEGSLKDDQVGDITLEGESTSTVSERMTAVSIDENQQEDQENIAPGREETVQESSPEEETPVVTSRSLRRRTVTVISMLQKKTKPGVRAGVEKAEADRVTDVNEADKTSLCVYSEVSVAEKDAEDTSKGGKVTAETEKQECVLAEQENEALITKDIPEIELNMEEMANKGGAVMEESEAKEKGEMAPDTEVSADVEATTKEEEKLSQVKSTDENMDGEMILLVQGNTAQEKEIPAGGPANVVVEATSQAEGMVEGEVDSTGNESRQKTGVTKPAYETAEEEEPIITRSLRHRTVTVKTPMQRKSKRICQEPEPEMPTETPQPEKEAPLGEASNELETVELITAVEDKNERRITEEKSEDSQVAFEGASQEVVTLGEQEGTSTAEPDGEKVEKITDGEKDMVERVPEDKMEERTTEDANNEKVDVNVPVEGKDFRDNDLEEEPDKEEEGSANPEQEDDQPENVLDKLEEQTFEEKSEGEFGVVVEEKMSTTEINLDELEEGVGVERRSLRKRTIKTTSGRKSKRMRKQDQDEPHVSIAEDALPVEKPADVKPLAEEVTGQEEEEIADNSEKDGQLSEDVCGERNKSTEEEKDGHELISMSDTSTQLEAQEGKKGEEEEEDKVEIDEYKEEVREQENKSMDEGNRTVDTVEEIKESQQQAEPNERDGQECSEISHTIDESFTLELDEEEENNGPQENKGAEEMEALLMECPNEASAAIDKTDKHKEHATEKEEEPAVKKSPALRGRSSAEASPEQRSTRRSRRFLQESPSEREVADEQEEKSKPQQKRKAIVDSTPRRSKRLARPKIV